MSVCVCVCNFKKYRRKKKNWKSASSIKIPSVLCAPLLSLPHTHTHTHAGSCYYPDYHDEVVRSSPSHSAHADCNLEITPNEEFLKTRRPLCAASSAPFPALMDFLVWNPFPPPVLSALQGVWLARPSLPPSSTPTPSSPSHTNSTNWGRLVLMKRIHNHCFCC